MEELSKLQLGIQSYYDGSFEDDNGAIIEQLVIDGGLTMEEYNLCIQWLSAYNDFHMYDTVIFGCDCGCGGDSMDTIAVEKMEVAALENMKNIQLKLGAPPLDNYDN